MWRTLTPETWDDFVELSGGVNGGCGGCWCTWWRHPRSEWENLGRDGRRENLLALAKSGKELGVIGYIDGIPSSWCAVSRYADYPTMHRSKICKYASDRDTWCISCIYVRPGFRRRGLMATAIAAGAQFAFSHGAQEVIGFPQVPNGRVGYVDWFVGTTSSFTRAGFELVESRGAKRTLVRLEKSQCFSL